MDSFPINTLHRVRGVIELLMSEEGETNVTYKLRIYTRPILTGGTGLGRALR